MHVLRVAGTLEGYRCSRTFETKRARCTINCIHEHVANFWTNAGQVGLRCIEMNFKMCNSMNECDFVWLLWMLQLDGISEP